MLTSVIGIVGINIKSIYHQHDIFANEVRLIISSVLEVMLIHYMFSICSQYFNNTVKLSKALAKKEKFQDKD